MPISWNQLKGRQEFCHLFQRQADQDKCTYAVRAKITRPGLYKKGHAMEHLPYILELRSISARFSLGRRPWPVSLVFLRAGKLFVEASLYRSFWWLAEPQLWRDITSSSVAQALIHGIGYTVETTWMLNHPVYVDLCRRFKKNVVMKSFNHQVMYT